MVLSNTVETTSTAPIQSSTVTQIIAISNFIPTESSYSINNLSKPSISNIPGNTTASASESNQISVDEQHSAVYIM